MWCEMCDERCLRSKRSVSQDKVAFVFTIQWKPLAHILILQLPIHTTLLSLTQNSTCKIWDFKTRYNRFLYATEWGVCLVTASADVELLMCCFWCAAGKDQVLNSALSAIDLSRLAGGGCVPVQMVMWYLQQPMGRNRRNLSARDWKMRNQSLTEHFGVTWLVESQESEKA